MGDCGMSTADWYKDAIIYQAHVRAFLDTNGDGVGDFPGLTEKLDYLQALGIDTIWLLPFYPSPLRDDGYDIADYENIHPAYGMLADFDRFITEAHRRNIRVITELVINHTSDQHPWFQAARRAPAGSPARNFYVWSETNQRYQGVPIIFSDTEKSNWTWDDVAGAYYWHRFFHHQPDLNFDNPEVLQAVLRVMHFWLDRGVDGMRLDAVPYLIERENTPCANLDETHAVLKRIRAELDTRHQDRLLLAEANQWPADVRPYFGDGDECHMAFHFPLMPRMYMALRQEDRHPIVEVLRQTPDIPDSCQWGLFLRNHDELTLEMVTDEERDYMYQTYATDPQMLINGGIRRRLAPLMENSRRRIELMNSLLFSLPGTPVIYYGDEIGMGDNIYLGDRNAVRTPMQWTGDRNAGFSRADSARLYAPLIADPVYGYPSVNVEAQERLPFSLLNWTKRMIAQRKQHPVFGRGTLEFLPAQNRKVLAYIRKYQDDVVLCVANLSRNVQPVELDLSRFKGMAPVEMLGQTEFPRIGDQPYFLSLGTYGFHWFRIHQTAPALTERTSPDTSTAAPTAPPLLVGPVWDTLLDGTVRTLLERDFLGPFLQRQPWFQGTRLRTAKIIDWGALRRGPEPLFGTLIDVEFDGADDQGGQDRAGTFVRQYFLPLAVTSLDTARVVTERAPYAIVARVTGARKGLLFDAWHDDRFAELILQAADAGETFVTRRGVMAVRQLPIYAQLRRDSGPLTISRVTIDPRAPLVSYGNQLSLKLFRRVERGVHPEVEVTRHVAEHAGFTHALRIGTVLEYERRDTSRDGASTLGMLQEAVESQADGWTYTMDWLGRYFEQVAARPTEALQDVAPTADVGALQPPPLVQSVMAAYLETASVLGRRTADMHLALAADPTNAAFAPEPLRGDDVEQATRDAMMLAERVLRTLATAVTSTSGRLTADAIPLAERLLASPEAVFARIRVAGATKAGGARIRIHGDYRLAQVLIVEGDIYLQNFEGHPTWPAAAQKEKQSPLRDVASILRSISYAAHAALLKDPTPRPAEVGALEPWAHLWQAWTTKAFIQAYLSSSPQVANLVGEGPERDELLAFFMLDRALRELDGELNNRPDWVSIPLTGILELLNLGRAV
jgi:maltose alpha-D-glucosyltransferase / alpha-amylase